METPVQSRRDLLRTAAVAAGGSLGAAATADAAAASSGWPQFMADAGNTGHGTGRAPVRDLRVDWAARLNGAGAPPAVVEGLVLVPRKGGLVAFDGGGEERWTAEMDAPSAPAVTGDTVYVTASNGLRALAADSGSERWRFGAATSLPVVAGSVFVSGNNGAYALTAEQGRVEWHAPVGEPVGPPAVADGTAFLGTTDGTVHALAADSGAERWRTSIGESGTVAATATADRVFAFQGGGGTFLDPGGELVVLDAATGNERWRVESGSNSGTVGRTAVADGTVFVPVNGALRALDAATGNERWRYDAPVRFAPAVVDGSVYVGEDGGRVSVLSASDGARVGGYQFEGPNELVFPPVPAAGLLFVATTTDEHPGWLHALRGEARDGARSPTPTRTTGTGTPTGRSPTGGGQSPTGRERTPTGRGRTPTGGGRSPTGSTPSRGSTTGRTGRARRSTRGPSGAAAGAGSPAPATRTTSGGGDGSIGSASTTPATGPGVGVGSALAALVALVALARRRLRED